MARKKINMPELKINFNDITMRELKLDIDDNNHIYDMDTESVYMIKEKYIKYSEDEYPHYDNYNAFCKDCKKDL